MALTPHDSLTYFRLVTEPADETAEDPRATFQPRAARGSVFGDIPPLQGLPRPYRSGRLRRGGGEHVVIDGLI